MKRCRRSAVRFLGFLVHPLIGRVRNLSKLHLSGGRNLSMRVLSSCSNHPLSRATGACAWRHRIAARVSRARIGGLVPTKAQIVYEHHVRIAVPGFATMCCDFYRSGCCDLVITGSARPAGNLSESVFVVISSACRGKTTPARSLSRNRSRQAIYLESKMIDWKPNHANSKRD